MSIISNPTIITKEVLVTLLDASTKPVIFWDTCSLLDIIRLPAPKREHPVRKLEQAMAITQKIVSGDIISLASELTVGEFNHHVGHTQNEVVAAAKEISQLYNKYMEFVRRANPAITMPSVDLQAYNLEILLSGLVQDIVVQTKFIQRDDYFLNSAEDRLLKKIPPAKKKAEFKDCYIWLTCLTVRQMSKKTSKPFGFLSSNVKDYSKAPSKQFDPYLAAEATAADIIYYADIDIAHGILTREGIF